MYDSASAGFSEISAYNDSVGWLNVTDRAVNGFKVVTGQDDRFDVQDSMYLKRDEAKKLKDAAYTQPGAFESLIERKLGHPIDYADIEKLRRASSEFTRVDTYHVKTELLRQGFSDIKGIIRREADYEAARRNVRGAAAASLKAPSPSSHEKFGEVLLELCNGDQELVNEYMKNLSDSLGSGSEIQKNLPKIMEDILTRCEAQEKTALGSKSYSVYEVEYEAACKKVLGEKGAKEAARDFVQSAKVQSAYTEIGLTIATSLLLPGSSVVRGGMQRAAVSFGQKAAVSGMKAAMTFGMGSMPAVLSVANAVTSEQGMTEEKLDEIKEKFKNGMMYGGFGAYVSGPLGSVMEKVLSKSPSLMSNVVSKAMGAATETTADVLFDRLTSDLSFKESLEQNGVMNFSMMIAGGRIHKDVGGNVSGLKDLSISKADDGSFVMKDASGAVVFKAKDENALMGFVVAKGAAEVKTQDNTEKSKLENTRVQGYKSNEADISAIEMELEKANDMFSISTVKDKIIKLEGNDRVRLGKIYLQKYQMIMNGEDSSGVKVNDPTITERLQNIKNEDGTDKFTQDEVQILNKVIEKDYPELINVVEIENGLLFENQYIDYFVNIRTEEEKSLVSNLLKMKNSDGSPRFIVQQIKSIAESYKNNKELTKSFIDMKNSDGSYRFYGCEMELIMKLYENNTELTKSLIDMKNPDGSYRFNAYDIELISKSYENKNGLTKTLVDMKNPDGSYRFYEYEMESIMELYENNSELTKTLVNMKNPDGSYRFNTYEMKSIMKLYENNSELTKTLVDMKNPDGSYRFNAMIINAIEHANLSIDKENALLKCLKMKNPSGEYRFDSMTYDDIVCKFSEEDFNFDLYFSIADKKYSDGTYKYTPKMVNNLYIAQKTNINYYNYLENQYNKISEVLQSNNISQNFDIAESCDIDGGILLTVKSDNGSTREIILDENYNIIKDNTILKSNNTNVERIKMPDKKVEFSLKSELASFNNSQNYNKLIESTKIVNDKDGNLLYKEFYVQSKDVDGKFDIIREDTSGKQYKIGIAERNSAGDTIIEKTLVDNSGIKTNYFYMDAAEGRLSYTKITDKNGKVLLDNKQKFKIIDETHILSVENGQKYDIEYQSDKVVVTRGDGEKVEISLGDIAESTLDKNLLPLLKQLPGSVYFDIKKYDLKKIGKNINSVQRNNAHYNIEYKTIALSEGLSTSEHIFTLLHELGHYKDYANKNSIHSNKELLDIYNSERIDFITNQPNIEVNAMEYFIKSGLYSNMNPGGPITEMIAETNALLYSNNHWDTIEQRGQYLQQYFPKTFAKISELLTK